MNFSQKIALHLFCTCYSSVPLTWAFCKQELLHHRMWSLVHRGWGLWEEEAPFGGLSLLGFVSLSLGLWQWPATLKAFWSWQWCPAKRRQVRPVTCSLTHVSHRVSSEETQTKEEIQRKTRLTRYQKGNWQMTQVRMSRAGVAGLGTKEKEEWGACG